MFIKDWYKEYLYSWSSNSEPKQVISASKYFVYSDQQNNWIPNILTQSQQKIMLNSPINLEFL